MSVIADCTVPTESFALRGALEDNPQTALEAERVATHSAEWALPFLWASGGDREAFIAALRDDPTVEDAAVIEAVDGSVLYKVQWCDRVIELVNEMIDQHAVILEAEAQSRRWRFKLRFAEEGQVATFQRHFTEQGHAFEVNRLYRPTEPRRREYGLTAEQYETLVTALDRGYFEIPRTVSTDDLAEILGISSNAVSQRLRRASANLVRNTLLIGPRDPGT
ncbi:helix-turn-helix domain-containing protein [Halomarina pelagica]|uniref:helix-turn-helix domain-containing protein n=1 Tax=Halomarina pelagica TaxID=2961599 RepID=UPI0020C27EE4|nr:helix-turn-helix domain-containing protein [Halomarina sp. BND7]